MEVVIAMHAQGTAAPPQCEQERQAVLLRLEPAVRPPQALTLSVIEECACA